MKTRFEDISSVKKKVYVEVEAQEVSIKLKEAFRDLGKRVKIPGFRTGKVPQTILEKRFGNQVMEEVSTSLVQETLANAFEENQMSPLSMPVIEKEVLKRGEDFQYAATVEVRPQMELKEYLGLQVEKEIRSVSDGDVEKELEIIRRNHGHLRPVEEERGLKDGHYAVIDYEGFQDGRRLEGIAAKNFLLKIGSNDFHPELENGLLGMERGQEKEVTVHFTEDHHNKGLAGKTVLFRMKLNDIKEMELPELNDAFAKELGTGFSGIDDLKVKLREEINKSEEARIDRELKRRLIEKISEGVQFDLPESLVEAEITMAIENVSQNLIRAGSSLEKAGLDAERLREELRPASKRRVKEMLVLGEVAMRHQLEISEAEISDEYEAIGRRMGQDSGVVRRYYEASRLVDSLTDRLLQEKALNFLVEGAKILQVEADKITRGEEQDTTS